MRNSDHIIDELLVINCQQGDRQVLELLVKRWDSRIVRRIYLTTHDSTASRDIAQEAWITIIRKIKSLRDPGAFEWWSLRIATAKAIDWIRANQLSRKREDTRRTAQEDFMEAQETASEEVVLKLRNAIASLPDEQRTVIQMFYQESLNVRSIGHILSIPNGTVKSRLFKAREKLKKMLNETTTES